jgi:hypothetical protein
VPYTDGKMRLLLVACFATIGVMTAQTTPTPKPEPVETVAYDVIQISGADGAELKQAEVEAAAAQAKLLAVRAKIRTALGHGATSETTPAGRVATSVDITIWGQGWALKTTRRNGPPI